VQKKALKQQVVSNKTTSSFKQNIKLSSLNLGTIVLKRHSNKTYGFAFIMW